MFIGGPNPALRDDQPYSQAHYDDGLREVRRSRVRSTATRRSSSTRSPSPVASASSGAKEQPEAFSEKTGKPDVRGAYGLHGREMIALAHAPAAHARARTSCFVGILDEKLDDFNRKIYVPQIDGAKTGLELPGIVDEVLTMTEIKDEDGKLLPRLRLPDAQPLDLPAKDRSGRLDVDRGSPSRPPDRQDRRARPLAPRAPRRSAARRLSLRPLPPLTPTSNT